MTLNKACGAVCCFSCGGCFVLVMHALRITHHGTATALAIVCTAFLTLGLLFLQREW